ncbi:AraC family transcriptional regulator [Actinoplanes sp. NBRC 14428]|uniref:Transcriptional regulator GlxA family with amidase domain n=1 Tax=Pseudosporangium ferrugineum TaxID=439699 RepID=A0A2T0SBH2_9ACTN|nr:helix-turn-helix domain-containing protein [Pseudosporangium ferrugineum]PRY30779.1 transcriptional regulator GlxA family with amidase domain [Pseudosporangium ferrugineum]BCJ50335.1 AraC family transcriptional regulator [Actinoplanes sp. NBRC 14428]
MPGRQHVVAVLALDGVVGFDLAVPCQVFGSTRLEDGGCPYEIRVCGQRPAVRTSVSGISHYRIEAAYDLGAAADADTIVVPGVAMPWRAPEAVLDVLRTAAARGRRIVSICTGAFVLAQAGLLDGRRATTHWWAAPDLVRRHPAVDVDAASLFAGDGRVFTSAGVAAGLDLCLHLVRRDHGAAVAARTAGFVVMAPVREGDQAQFVDHVPAGGRGSLAPTLAWLGEHVAEPLTVAAIARHARLSTRTLMRRFREQTGTTPLAWLHGQRLLLARRLLETTDLPVPAVAERSGHGSATALRAHFRRALRTSPDRYRRAFRGS